MTDRVSPALARRIGLAAQGFGGRVAAPGSRALRAHLERLGQLQIDSVNVFERAHYLPAFSRLGAYDRAALDRLTYGRRGTTIEYWPHQAGFIPRALWGRFAFRRDANRAKAHAPDGWLTRHDGLRRWVLDDLAANGPQRASALEHDAARGEGGWWGWSDAKHALEWMWRTGEVVCVDRERFERVYALPEQAGDAAAAPDVPRVDAVRDLVRLAASALGIATEADLADYWRMLRADVRPAIRDLVDAGELLPAEVPGWEQGGRPVPAWLHAEARRPRRIEAAALLAPFDPVVWFRPRAERMFGFHYRIEIYTPAPKRVYGYYSLPYLLDDRIVGRVDLKADRRAGVLRVQSAWREPHAPDDAAERLVPVLHDAASWQGLDDVVVARRGDLAAPIAGALGTRLVEPQPDEPAAAASDAVDDEAPEPAA